MKIAVVGCGAVGSYYGARLAQAGHEVHFLLRSDYDAVQRRGVLIRSPDGDFRAHPRAARWPEEIGPSALVLIGLKTTAREQYQRLLPPLVGPETAVLTLQNGLGNEEDLVRLFPVKQIMGGLCFVCLNRLEPGVILHMAHGQVTVGEFQRAPEPRTHKIAGTFRHAGVPCSVTDNLAQAHWEKLVWNIPFNGLGVAGVVGFDAVQSGAIVAPPDRLSRPPVRCLSTEELLADGRWTGLLRELMFEVITTARAFGFSTPLAFAENQIELTRTMGAYKASTLIDFEGGKALELESLFLEPLRRAKQAGVAVPRLETLCRVLQQLDPARAVAT